MGAGLDYISVHKLASALTFQVQLGNFVNV